MKLAVCRETEKEKETLVTCRDLHDRPVALFARADIVDCGIELATIAKRSGTWSWRGCCC